MLALLAGLWLHTADAHVPETYFVYPGDDWCSQIQAGYTGDLYLFLTGVYDGPCEITGPAPDQYGERLYLESMYHQDGLRAVFRGDGVADHVLRVRGFDVTFRAIEFDEGPADAIQVEGDGHIFENLVTGPALQGAAIRQVGDLTDFLLEECSFDGQGPGIALGCPGCVSEGTTLRENKVSGATTALSGTDGASAEVWLNAFEADVAVDWRDPGPGTVIEQTLVVAGSTGIRVVGGVALVRNNVVTAGAEALVVEGPHEVYGNTLHVPSGAAVGTSGDVSGLDYRNNAQVGAEPAAGTTGGNVDCSPDACDCWLDPSTLDFYPSSLGPLVGAAVELPFGSLEGDFCNRPRANGSSGALDSQSVLGPGPFAIEMPTDWDCLSPVDPEPGSPDFPCAPDTQTEGDTGTGTGTGSKSRSRTKKASGGCGCSAPGGGSAGWGVAAGLALLIGRRRRI